MKYTVQLREKPPPQADGAQYLSLEADESPSAERPALVEEVQPSEWHGRHRGIGFELVLDTAMPQAGESS